MESPTKKTNVKKTQKSEQIPIEHYSYIQQGKKNYFIIYIL